MKKFIVIALLGLLAQEDTSVQAIARHHHRHMFVEEFKDAATEPAEPLSEEEKKKEAEKESAKANLNEATIAIEKEKAAAAGKTKAELRAEEEKKMEAASKEQEEAEAAIRKKEEEEEAENKAKASAAGPNKEDEEQQAEEEAAPAKPKISDEEWMNMIKTGNLSLFPKKNIYFSIFKGISFNVYIIFNLGESIFGNCLLISRK